MAAFYSMISGDGTPASNLPRRPANESGSPECRRQRRRAARPPPRAWSCRARHFLAAADEKRFRTRIGTHARSLPARISTVSDCVCVTGAALRGSSRWQ